MQDFDQLFEKIIKKSSQKQKPQKPLSRRSSKNKLSSGRGESKIGRNTKDRNGELPIHLRYQQDMQEKENRMCSLKQSIEREKLEKLANSPSPSRTRSNKKIKVEGGLEQNTAKFLERKSNNIKRVQTDLMYQEMQQLTFKPKINNRSSKMVEKTGRGSASPVQERLYKEASLREERIKDLKEDLFKMNCPFRPVTNGNSSKRGEASPGSMSRKNSAKSIGTTQEQAPSPAKPRIKISKPNPAQTTLNLAKIGKGGLPFKEPEDNFSFRDSVMESAKVSNKAKNSAKPTPSKKTPVKKLGLQSKKELERDKENHLGYNNLSKMGAKEDKDEYCPTFGNYKLMNF